MNNYFEKRGIERRRHFRRKRDKLKRIFFWVFFLVIFFWIIFLSYENFNATGKVTLDDKFKLDELEKLKNVSQLEILEKFNRSEEIILEMEKNNFSTAYMKDVLLEAKKVYERAKYAEILRNDSLSYEEQREARMALRLVDWEGVYYGSVLEYAQDIENRFRRAFIISDSLNAVNFRIKDLSKKNLNISSDSESLEKARMAFYEDRYDESEKILSNLINELEKRKLDDSILGSIKRASKSFIIKYWYYFLGFLIILGIGGFFGYKKLRKNRLMRKINRMKSEQVTLNNLMKKVQEERFKENSISKIVYDIRMKKYKERLSEIKRRLPVLEANFRKKRF